MISTLAVFILQNDIVNALKTGNKLILQATTGSGKSTLLPQFIVDHVLEKHEKVFVLQQRRIAARSLAAFISKTRGTKLGEEVGYQIRLEKLYSESSRIIFLTEGILLNMLLENSLPKDVGAIVFDEFHERHIETDIGLALALENQKNHPELKIVVMSASLNTKRLQDFMNSCKLLISESKAFAMETIYNPLSARENTEEAAVNALRMHINKTEDEVVLMFMPGKHEINRSIGLIEKSGGFSSYKILPLHASLSKEEQEDVFTPGRKILVCSNVAETSITIPGVSLVIDSGLEKQARYDHRRGVNTLFTVPISKSSALQRQGRAGRTKPGKCIRLWSAFEQQQKHENTTPEIHRIDLSGIILGLIASDYSSFENFPFYESPDSEAIVNALRLLKTLNAIDEEGKITSDGRYMAILSVHPRYGKILLSAKLQNCLAEACIIAALAQNRGLMIVAKDSMMQNERLLLFGEASADLLFQYQAWYWSHKQNYEKRICNSLGINTIHARNIYLLAKNIWKQCKQTKPFDNHIQFLTPLKEEALRKAIFASFADFLFIRRNKKSNQCHFIDGQGGLLHKDSIIKESGLMVATDSEEAKNQNGTFRNIREACLIDISWLEESHLPEISKSQETVFDTSLGRVMVKNHLKIGSLMVYSSSMDQAGEEESALMLTDRIINGEIPFDQWDEKVDGLVNRINFAAFYCPEYQINAINNDEKRLIIQHAIYGCRSVKEISKVKLQKVLSEWLTYDQQKALAYLAPESIQLATRKFPVKYRYNDKYEVILSETVQALYDCPFPILLADGKAGVIFEILSPARRPVQMTRDLKCFWENSYQAVKKDLRGRYPKHEWR
ncbi:MAG: ATP-dependent helicase C-terminal domain-containing protein [Bacteroidales bacterium]|nr:ATP-dependent helicase C-terminal domain-containing protein [Bacteroidales bacterium]